MLAASGLSCFFVWFRLILERKRRQEGSSSPSGIFHVLFVWSCLRLVLDKVLDHGSTCDTMFQQVIASQM